jgi:hypothetical protein
MLSIIGDFSIILWLTVFFWNGSNYPGGRVTAQTTTTTNIGTSSGSSNTIYASCPTSTSWQTCGDVTVSIVNNDLYNMPSIQYVHLAGNNEEEDDMVVAAEYTKIKSIRRIYEDNTVEVLWEGIILDRDRVGSATFLQLSNTGALGGTFTTEENGYTLLKFASSGKFHLRALSLSFLNDTEETDKIDSTNINKDGSSTNPIADKVTVEKVIPYQKIKEEDISDGPASGAIQGRQRRLTHQQQQHRNLQVFSTVDVLVLITNRAMCEAAGLSIGCANSDLNRVAMNILVGIAQNNVLSSMTNGGIPVRVRFVSTEYLSATSDNDRFANVATLNWISGSKSIQDLRKKVGADLVAVVGAVDPATGSCGTSQINGHASIVAWTCFSIFTLTHEL